jgi:hypothetical protein
LNEHIKSLSQKALDYAAEQYGPQRRDEKVWEASVFDEKFAELIVRACIDIALANDDPYTAVDIGNYFGVK